MSDLRRRRRSATRTDIVAAAVTLFEAEGFDMVTMEQIAGAAGVSRRTLYRHFPTKDRVVLDTPLDQFAMWDAVVDAAAPDARGRDMIVIAARELGRLIDADRDTMRSLCRIVDRTPSLQAAFLANPEWTVRAVEVLTDPRREGSMDELAATVIAGAHLGAIDAVMMRWASGAEPSVTDAVDAVLQRLGPIWPANEG